MVDVIVAQHLKFWHLIDRYGTAYWVEMMKLPDTHPALYEDMCQSGSWTVQRIEQEPFSSIAGDQAIEQTVNRDSKTSGGLKGITLNRGKFVKFN